MKNRMVIPLLLLLVACGPKSETDPKVILKKASDKCMEIQNGYYEMTMLMKYMTDKDTLKHTLRCHFKKIKGDTLFGKAFHYTGLLGAKEKEDQLYTGTELVSLSLMDSSAEITSCKKWASDIRSYSHNYTFYTPLTDNDGVMLANDSNFKAPSINYQLLGQERINNVRTYHVLTTEIPKKVENSDMQTLRIQYHYWINKSDFVPVQYSIIYDVVMGNDTMCQYEKVILDKYEINNLKDETPIQLASIPSYYKKKDYVPYVEPVPLPLDTIAPGWDLMSLTGEKIKLSDFKGKLVLLDFFYKGCYPCMQALPVLQTLSEKYKSKGLLVIGIDPYDKKEEGIAEFLKKRGVTYTVLLGAEAVAKEYRVQGYPTMFLVSKTGKVINVQMGFGNDVEAEMGELIKKNL